MSEQEIIRIEEEPTPEKEAGTFQSKDDARVTQKNQHTIALLNAKKGWVDTVIGVLNPARNGAFLVCIPLMVLMLIFGSIAALHEKPETFSRVFDGLLNLLVLVVGVAIGAASGKSKD